MKWLDQMPSDSTACEVFHFIVIWYEAMANNLTKCPVMRCHLKWFDVLQNDVLCGHCECRSETIHYNVKYSVQTEMAYAFST